MAASEAAALAVAERVAELAETDRRWALKRDWTDVDFQDGAEANAKVLQGFEDELVARLRRSTARALARNAPETDDAHLARGEACEADDVGGQGVLARVLSTSTHHLARQQDAERIRKEALADPEVLGSSLDIVGAYLKNYEVDKAAAIIETIFPVCLARGGLWYLKALNHLATVRMKQSRPDDALATLNEMDAYASSNVTASERDEAWEFWETVYRNFAWTLSALNREMEATSYIQRGIALKERLGIPASWFDHWDMGRMLAYVALRGSSAEREIMDAQKIITKALWLHKEKEPTDLVMRAKIWHSVGECSFAVGHTIEVASSSSGAVENPNARATNSKAVAHFEKALKCFKEAHKLFVATEGKYNPLTGGEAQAVSWTLLRLGACNDAKPYLLDALESASRQQSGWGHVADADAKAPALLNAALTVDRILEAHRLTDDRHGLVRYFDAIERLCGNVCGRLKMSKEREDAGVYEKLISSCSMIMVASGTEEGTAKSQKLMKEYMWDKPDTMTAKLCSSMMNNQLPGLGGAVPAILSEADPGMAALLQQMKMEPGMAAVLQQMQSQPEMAAMLQQMMQMGVK